MSHSSTVKVNDEYQITVPPAILKRLNIQKGDKLLVDVQDGVLILLPQPESLTTHMAGLHREVWEGIDTNAYLRGERESWHRSISD